MSERALERSDGSSGLSGRLSLKRNFAWALMGNVVYAGCQWAMIMVLAKVGSPEQVGQYSIGLAVTAPVILMANLHLGVVQATDARREYTFGHYLSLRLITTAAALVVICALAFSGIYHRETALVLFWMGLAKAVEATSDIFYGLLQQEERMDRVSLSMAIKGPLSLVTFSAGVYLTGKVVWGVLGLAVTWACLLFSYDMRVGKELLRTRNRLGEFHVRWNAQVFARLVKTALPLGFAMALVSVRANIPRYFLERLSGERDLGIFSAITYISVAGNMIVNALGQSANPRLAQHYASGEVRSFRRLLLRLVGIGAVLGAGGVFVAVAAGRPVLTVLYGAEYGQHTETLVISMVAAAVGFIGSFLGYGMTAARYLKEQMPLFTLVTLALVAACYVLVPALGLRGAAWASVIEAVLKAFGSGVVVMFALRSLTK